MRKKIAEHMVLSRRTSAHVHSVFEVNFSAIARSRSAKATERAGGKPTYLAFIVKAAVARALRAVPVLNSSVDGDNVIYHKDINIGVAVALEWGLIVPVIKHADTRRSAGRQPRHRGPRRRAPATKQLKPEDVVRRHVHDHQPGHASARSSACRSSTSRRWPSSPSAPSKNAPPSSTTPSRFRPMAYLALGFDHRIIDGAVADSSCRT